MSGRLRSRRALPILQLLILVPLLAVVVAVTVPAARAQTSDPATAESVRPLDALTAELLDYNQQLETALAEEARLNASSQQLQGFRRDAMVALGHLAGQPTTWSGEAIHPNDLRSQALEWATTRGSRSGRVAFQFIQDLAGRLEKNLQG